MKCNAIKENLYHIGKGALSPFEETEILIHLKHCPSCAAEYDEVNRIKAVFKNTLEPVPASILHNIEAAAGKKQGFSIPFLKPLPVAAFALSLLLLISILKITTAADTKEDELAAFIYDSYAQSAETYDNEIPSNIEYVTYAY